MLYVHASTVRRIINQYDVTGDVAPKVYRRGPERMLGQCEETSLVESLLANSSIYLDELQQELYDTTGTWCSVSTIHRAVHRLGFTQKKLRYVAMHQYEVRRVEFMEEMKYRYDRLVRRIWL